MRLKLDENLGERVLVAALASSDPRSRLWVVDSHQVRVYLPEAGD